MFLLKFLSLAAFSLLFLGNVSAECVDLSGTYLCSNGETVTISKIFDENNIDAYTLTQEENGIKATRPILESSGTYRTGSTCDENQIVDEFEAHGGYTIIATVGLTNEKRKLTISIEVLHRGVFKQKGEISCDRI